MHALLQNLENPDPLAGLSGRSILVSAASSLQGSLGGCIGKKSFTIGFCVPDNKQSIMGSSLCSTGSLEILSKLANV